MFCTIPIALLMGLYSRFVRPGRIGQMSALGVILLLAALVFGKMVSESPEVAPWFTFAGPTLALIVIAYGFCASVLPVWLLLAPRDYLSTFLKIGTIPVARHRHHDRAAGELQTSAVTKLVDGSGPVWAGSLFPFLFITIACGSVSDWHALISSGTAPKMIENERQIPFIGWNAGGIPGAIMAMIAATVIHPGVYFAMNSNAALIGADPGHAAEVITSWGFTVTPDMLTQVAKDVGESTIMSRTGGAPTLAGHGEHPVRLPRRQADGGDLVPFAILFEALFILTTVDAGTRVCRFMIQDLVGNVVPAFKATESWANNLIGSPLACLLWGYFLYQGVVEPLGGIFTLRPLFGTANQMLAAITLTLCTVVLFKMKRQRYAWVTIVPATWLVLCTVTAGVEKVFSDNPAVGFLSHAQRFSSALAESKVLAPAKSLAEMGRVVFNDYVDATLAGVFAALVVTMVVFGVIHCRRAMGNPRNTTSEIGGGVLPVGAGDD